MGDEEQNEMARVQQAIDDKAAGKEPVVHGPGEDGYGGSPLYAMLKKDGLEDSTRSTRQQRRAEERASAKRTEALAKMAENAERVALGDAQAAKMQRMRIMLFALVKQLGRARLTQHELNAVEPGSGLDVKVQPNGDLVVTFLRGRDR